MHESLCSSRDCARFRADALCGVIALSVALLSGCSPTRATASRDKEVPPVTVQLTNARESAITRYVSLPAQVTPNQQVVLYSKVAGYLKRIEVDEGDEVQAGQLLAEIEVPELLADRAKYVAELELAKLEHQRAADAQKKAPDLVMLQTLDATQGRLKVAEANLERINTQLGFCRITAPFAGVIARRMADHGAFIPAATSGSAAQNAALLTLTDFSTVRVQVAVPEAEVPLIKNDLGAKVLIEELPGRAFEGKVSRYAQILDEATRTMLAEIDLPNPRRELRPGMFATVKIGVETRSNRMVLPADAVVFEKAGASVFTVADNKAKKVPVKTGFNDGALVEIVEGLPPETPAILVGKLALVNGTPVTVIASK